MLDEVLKPLVELLPPDRAMGRLVCPMAGGTTEQVAMVDRLITDPAIAGNPALVAGLWLYVDELDRSHHVSQSIDNATGSFWHGIMHRREGDFGNSHYWFRKVGHHPAMDQIEGYDPHAFIDAVEAAHLRGEGPASLQAMQREEWWTLMRWCAAE